MRVLLIRPYADFAIADVGNGIHKGLLDNGWEVEDYMLSKRLKTLAPGLRFIGGGKINEAEHALLASEAIPYKAVAEGCEWVIVICGGWVHPNALAVFRSLGGKVAVVFTEGPYQSDDAQELRLAQVCDIAFTNDRCTLPLFERVLAPHGGKAYYLPHSYDPNVHNLTDEGNEAELPNNPDCDVLLLGTGFTERVRLLEQIDWTGIDLALGGFWPAVEFYGTNHKLKKHIRWQCTDNKQLAKLYKHCKIVLNIHRWAEGAECINPRVYEAAACGAFQICDNSRPELTEVFEDSIPTYEYGNPWRLEALIRRMLADDEGHKRMAEKARRLVEPCTFTNRTRLIMEAIESYKGSRSNDRAALAKAS